ncbi:uncharacterized protein PGTG_07130 [Puccinia graminis f. sp. tritici CRL 75-36-700-3]|uniref:Uncharacterized protein n=1 Tax=Puccinia graminis f. sp. tritici (strain CRL 75-36-700-3 / race SCCL) TaxID=418459 RepID=E3K9D9_PUCGT|nr:uncharacterized protein PGTG_07130 [Puccinia graminis f. sp. tritici CRL 75-36-700-3]EFP80878.1 hypothetical protein PGTG_07130 [Puccinia graminis f. sp. tritici CRL 75-36-700-3]
MPAQSEVAPYLHLLSNFAFPLHVVLLKDDRVIHLAKLKGSTGCLSSPVLDGRKWRGGTKLVTTTSLLWGPGFPVLVREQLTDILHDSQEAQDLTRDPGSRVADWIK